MVKRTKQKTKTISNNIKQSLDMLQLQIKGLMRTKVVVDKKKEANKKACRQNVDRL